MVSLISICLIAGMYFFIPHVWLLNKKDVVLTVTRWTKQRGAFREEVSPSYNSWVSIDQVSKNLINALIVAEDGRFFEHSGIDLYEIKDSLKLNLSRKKYARGASTITQQVVKMVFLSNKKSIVRKIREILGAVLLEKVCSKDRILEWYLNLVEFGDGAYGIKKGAWYYFQTASHLLTIEQSIHLVLVLPSPNNWNQGLKTRSLTDFGKKRFTQILYRMKLRGFITDSQYNYVLSTGNFGSSLKDNFDPDSALEDENLDVNQNQDHDNNMEIDSDLNTEDMEWNNQNQNQN